MIDPEQSSSATVTVEYKEPEPKRPLRPARQVLPNVHKIGRNSRCPCQSGAKFKKCCLKKMTNVN